MGHHSGENATVRLWSVSLDYSFFFFCYCCNDRMGTFGLGGEDRDRRFCGIFLSLFLIFLFSFASSLATEEEEEVRDRLGN